jgi:L-rhamnose mutarotase
MQEDRSHWPSWASVLKKNGVKDLTILLLEGAGPFRILLAQAMYAGLPFFSQSNHLQSWKAFADLLDDPQESKSFVSFLREEV